MILQINSTPSLAVNIPIMITPNLRHDPSLLIDIKDFMPVVVSSTDKNNIRIHSSFSLANLDRDAGERLRALVRLHPNFPEGIHPRPVYRMHPRRCRADCIPGVLEGLPAGISHREIWQQHRGDGALPQTARVRLRAGCLL